MSKDDNRVMIGASIRQSRESQGWSREQLAEMCAYKVATIEKIEDGAISVNLDVLYVVCSVLGLEIMVKESNR